MSYDPREELALVSEERDAVQRYLSVLRQKLEEDEKSLRELTDEYTRATTRWNLLTCQSSPREQEDVRTPSVYVKDVETASLLAELSFEQMKSIQIVVDSARREMVDLQSAIRGGPR